MDAVDRLYRLVAATAVLLAIATAAPVHAAGPAAELPTETPGAMPADEVHYPVLGFTFGVAGFLSSYDDVESPFHTIEAAYAAQGIQLSSARDVAMQPMLMPTFTLQINRWLAVAWQAGLSRSDRDEFRMTGGLVTGRYALPMARAVTVFGGLGGGKYGFKFSRSYGQVVDGSTGGSYTTLDEIQFEGGGPYWTAAAGVSVRPDRRVAIEGMFQHFGMNDESTIAEPGVPVSVNLSGSTIGGSLTVFFW